MNLCQNCPRNCNINRKDHTGYCGVNEQIKLARAGLHFGEEPCISGKNGSGTIFFSGCSLKCVMCQNYQISHDGFGKYITQHELIDIMKKLENSGAHNINFVTPTHYLSQIENALNIYRPNIPLVYNSSGYESDLLMNHDSFDIYLFDLKFLSSKKSTRYAKCNDYFQLASKIIKKAVDKVGAPIFDSNGILKRGVIVRHLILPQSTNDSIEIIKWLDLNARNVIFSLMSQYVPLYKAHEYPEINRKITKREYNKVLEECYNAHFYDTYIQDRKSATTEFIPEFDLTGI